MCFIPLCSTQFGYVLGSPDRSGNPLSILKLVLLDKKERPTEAAFLFRKTFQNWERLQRKAGLASDTKTSSV